MLGSWELQNMDRRSRHPDDAKTKFEHWVLSQGGTSVVAKKMGTHQVTVSTWISRRAIPNTIMTAKILELANGYLTIQDIIEATKP